MLTPNKKKRKKTIRKRVVTACDKRIFFPNLNSCSRLMFAKLYNYNTYNTRKQKIENRETTHILKRTTMM